MLPPPRKPLHPHPPPSPLSPPTSSSFFYDAGPGGRTSHPSLLFLVFSPPSPSSPLTEEDLSYMGWFPSQLLFSAPSPLFPAAIKHSVHIRVEGWSARNSPAVAESIHVARRTNTVTHWYRAPGFSPPHNCITALYSLCVRVRAHSRFSGVLFFFWLGFCSRVVLIEAIDRVYCVCDHPIT